MSLRYLIVFCAALLIAEALKLPDFFNKCKKSDPDIGKCITKNVNDNLKEFTKGLDSYHFPSFYPLKVPFIHIDVNGGLVFNLTDIDVTGLENSICNDAKVDFEKNHIELFLLLPKISILAMYDITGRILILPITGQGPANITFVGADVHYEFDYELKEKGKNTYMVPKNSKFVYKPERVYFVLQNLFNGDERLGSEMSKFLDESWKEVNEEIGAKVGEAVGELITGLLANFFWKVPFDELYAS